MSKCGGLHCPGCDSGGGTVLLIIGAVLLLSAGGTVAAVVHDVIRAVEAVFIVTALTVAAGVAGLVYRALHPALVPWNPPLEGVVRATVAQSAVVHELTGERPAIGPREVHQHTHYHWHGVDEDRQAEIRRRQEG